MKYFNTVILTLFIIIFSVEINTAETMKTFPDIQNHWARDSIIELTKKGIAKGYPNGTFKPNDNISRAEFGCLIYKILELEPTSENQEFVLFNKITGHWSENYIKTLVNNKIIDPTDYENGYDLDGDISRVEMTKMIVKALGKDTQAKDYKNNTGFQDDEEIDLNEKGYIHLAKYYNIINGFPDGTFRPDEKATRAEAMKIIDGIEAATKIINEEKKSKNRIISSKKEKEEKPNQNISEKEEKSAL